MSTESARFDNAEEDLRERIATLERELEEAKNETKRSEGSIETIGRQERNHHTEANLNQYGRTPNVVFIDPKKEHQLDCSADLKDSGVRGAISRFLKRYNINEFIRRPILHQWIHNGKVYREAKERVSSRFELFFDLLFVGIIHQIAESTAETPNGIGLAKYILTFCPAFSIWSDVRDLVNQFATDDVTQRCYILWIMVLLVGYSNNAAAIELVSVHEELTNASATALRWAIGFFIAAKFSKVLLNSLYGLWLPASRIPLMTQSLNALFVILLFLIAIFTPVVATFTLVSVAIFGEYAIKVVGILLLRTVERHKMRSRTSTMTTITSTTIVDEESVNNDLETGGKGFEEIQLERAKKHIKFPAINIEHHVDRLGSFVTIVLGEMVVNIFFHASLASGLNEQSGRSMLGLMIAFNLNWIYFDSEACRKFVHALRRHWFTGFAFTVLHLPLSLALLLSGAAMNRLIIGGTVSGVAGSAGEAALHARAEEISATSTISAGIYYFFGVGIGTSVICMATIGVMHKNMDSCKRRGILKLSRSFVIGTRYTMGILMVLLPIGHEHLTPLTVLGIYVGITAFLIAEETFSRLERSDKEEEEDE